MYYRAYLSTLYAFRCHDNRSSAFLQIPMIPFWLFILAVTGWVVAKALGAIMPVSPNMESAFMLGAIAVTVLYFGLAYMLAKPSDLPVFEPNSPPAERLVVSTKWLVLSLTIGFMAYFAVGAIYGAD